MMKIRLTQAVTQHEPTRVTSKASIFQRATAAGACYSFDSYNAGDIVTSSTEHRCYRQQQLTVYSRLRLATRVDSSASIQLHEPNFVHTIEGTRLLIQPNSGRVRVIRVTRVRISVKIL